MKNGKAIRSNSRIKSSEVMAIAAQDKRAYSSHYKRVPATSVAKIINVGGVPHKFVDGQMIPMVKKVK